MQRILLTGATGFLGSHLLDALLKQGYDVTILKRSTSDTWRIDPLLTQVAVYDIDKITLQQAFQAHPVDAVIHTACHYGRNTDSLADIVATNLQLGLRLMEAAKQHGVGCFLNTDTLLSKSLNAYTLSKKQFVEWLRQQRGEMSVANMRIEHMYGPRDDATKFCPWLLQQFSAHQGSLKLTAGEQQRDFVHVNDVVSAYLTVLRQHVRLAPFMEFDVGSGELTSVRTLVTTLYEAYIQRYGSSPATLHFGAVPYRAGENMRVEVDLTELRNLGWQPSVPLSQGLKQLMECDT